jgi:2'-5' RNA ligase
VAHVERIRSFIAVDIGPEVRAALFAMTRELARTGADARWVRPEGMHATLKFLGGVEPTQLEAVRSAVESVAGGHVTLTMAIRGLGAFPTLRRPRVLWAGLRCNGLAELARDIDAALTPLGFEPEKRAFNPHITLARIRSLRGWDALGAAVETNADVVFGELDVATLTIYRSTLRRDGAVYEALWTIPLAQHK